MVSKTRRCEVCGVRESVRGGFFARFPKDEVRLKIWVKQVGKEDLVFVPIEHLHEERNVCGDHFEKRDFGKTGRRLKKRAYPKLLLSAPPLSDQQMIEFPQHVASKQRSADTLHIFPNPTRDQNRFNSWVYAVGGGILGLTNEHISKYRRVCHRHFENKYVYGNNYLSKNAIPTKHLSDNVVKFVSDNESLRPIRNVATPGESTSKENRVTATPENVNRKPKYLPEIEPSTKIDLVPAPPEETQTLSGIDEVLADDFVTCDAPVPDHDPSPVPEVEDTAEKEVFSWQQTELIEADDADDPPVPPPPPPSPAPSLAVTCDSDQAVPTQPAPAEKDVENRCEDCAEVNEEFRFWCVECSRGALCGACAGRPPHRRHHVLRAPARADTAQTRAVLMVIRQQLQNENLLSPHETLDDGLKVEVKEEPPEPPPEPEPEPPAEPDPLACEPHEDQCIAEQIVDHPQPLKLPQLAEAHARKQNKTIETQLVKVSPAQVKRKYLFHLEKIVTPQQVKRLKLTFPACKENLLTLPSKVREYQGLKIISQTTGNLGTTRQNQARTQAHIERTVTTQQQVKGLQTTSQASKENLVTLPSKVREYQGPKSLLKTLTASPSQTARNFTDITRPNQATTQAPTCTKVTSEPQPAETVIIDLDGDETVEYLEEGLDSDIETVEEVVLDDNETNEDDALEDGETNEDDALDDRETNEDDALDDRETTEDDALDDREINEDDDGLDDRDDDVLDEDYLVDEDDLSEDDESDEDTIGNLARKGVQRKIEAKQTLPMRGPAKLVIIEDDLSDEDPIVSIAGRGVKRMEDVEETSPVPPHGSMAQELPSKAVVQVRPLSSLEIRNWTADRKRHRKY